MKIRTREIDEVTEVVIDGNVLQENVNVFRNRLSDLIENGKVKIVLNMSATSYISSLCLAVIVDVKNRLAPLHGDVKIIQVNRLIRNLLEITNLTKKVEIYDTIDDAASSFK